MRFNADTDKTKILGRTLYKDGVRYLGYTGTSITFTFTGKKAVAHIISDASAHDKINYAWAAVLINEGSEPYKRFEIDADEKDYVIYECDEEKTVTVTLIKFSEAEYAACGVAWLEIDTDNLMDPPAEKKRKIEMIGDSITCGYGDEGRVEVLELRTSEENPMKAYSLITARELDADVHIVAWNGKGVITSYIGDESNDKDETWLVPMLYEYTDAGCERDYFHNKKEEWEKWDFEKFSPDIVTMYLGTNDASYTREIPERNEEYIKAYIEFLDYVHQRRPNAPILCMLGTMDRRLCTSVDEAVKRYKSKNSDVMVEYLDLPHQEDADGLGTFWHPTAVTHRKVADLVEAKIKEMMNW